jgi:hypothetical protein
MFATFWMEKKVGWGVKELCHWGLVRGITEGCAPYLKEQRLRGDSWRGFPLYSGAKISFKNIFEI